MSAMHTTTFVSFIIFLFLGAPYFGFSVELFVCLVYGEFFVALRSSKKVYAYEQKTP